MIPGIVLIATIKPIIPPIIDANEAYIKYFLDICLPVYPKAFKVPIRPLCSSTILVIDVKLIKVAIKKNKNGNILPILLILSVSSLYELNP